MTANQAASVDAPISSLSHIVHPERRCSASVRLKFEALKGQLIPAEGNTAEGGAALVRGLK